MRLALFLLICIAVSCQTAQLVPADFSSGEPHATALGLRIDEKEFFLEHMPEDNQQLVFDLEVINESNSDYYFSPEKVILFMSNEPFPEMDTENQTALAVSHIKQQGGIGPLKARSARQVNQFFERKIRAQRAGQIAMLVLGTAFLITDAVADAKDATSEIVTEKQMNRAIMRDAATVSALAFMDIASMQMENTIVNRYEDLEYLPDEYLGAQLLLPKSAVRGKVFFPRKEQHRYYRMILSVNGKPHIFDLRYPASRERKALRRSQLP